MKGVRQLVGTGLGQRDGSTCKPRRRWKTCPVLAKAIANSGRAAKPAAGQTASGRQSLGSALRSMLRATENPCRLRNDRDKSRTYRPCSPHGGDLRNPSTPWTKSDRSVQSGRSPGSRLIASPAPSHPLGTVAFSERLPGYSGASAADLHRFPFSRPLRRRAGLVGLNLARC